MVFVLERNLKGKTYLYLQKSMRVGPKIIKASKLLGRKDLFSPHEVSQAIKSFVLTSDPLMVNERMKLLQVRGVKFRIPFIKEELWRIEQMALHYREIMQSLRKEDITDMHKRFVANFVFESNAIEGNSLTLRNYQEILFEKRISKSADLREVYDAQNSYQAFVWLLSLHRPLSERLIIEIHSWLMDRIDAREGYKVLPNILLGKRTRLCAPEDVPSEMARLLEWYHQNRGNLHALELAFRFHHRFEQIHPFADGNGRAGRMVLNYILLREGYFPVILRSSQRPKYLHALEAADHDQYIPLFRLALERAKTTYLKFFETYYTYTHDVKPA